MTYTAATALTATVALALTTMVAACAPERETTVTARDASGSEARDTIAKPADNSAKNERDQDGRTLTAGDQSDTPADIALTQSIRKQVVANDELSTMAHNVKIITVDGVVTLRGPVKSEGEKQQIAATAEKIAGAGKIQNQLEIAQ
jgi:hyperosmotically inducible protein